MKKLRIAGLLVLVMFVAGSVFARYVKWDPEYLNNSFCYCSEVLMNRNTPGQGVNSRIYNEFVGGVDFGSVAQPNSTLEIEQVRLNYNRNKKDGKRLEITLNDKNYVQDLPDWMLIPIALFANDTNTVCYTHYQENELDSCNGGRFHPAFKNTLLGARLYIADYFQTYLFMPKYKKRTITAFSEEKYIRKEALGDSIIQDQILLNKLMNTEYNNYIYTDYEERIVFDTDKETLSFSGDPYYRFVIRTGFFGSGAYEELPGMSLMSKILREVFAEINPYTWNASVKLMHYAAFFRFVKNFEDKANWKAFIQQIAKEKQKMPEGVLEFGLENK